MAHCEINQQLPLITIAKYRERQQLKRTIELIKIMMMMMMMVGIVVVDNNGWRPWPCPGPRNACPIWNANVASATAAVAALVLFCFLQTHTHRERQVLRNRHACPWTWCLGLRVCKWSAQECACVTSPLLSQPAMMNQDNPGPRRCRFNTLHWLGLPLLITPPSQNGVCVTLCPEYQK